MRKSFKEYCLLREAQNMSYLRNRSVEPVRVFIDEEEVPSQDWLDVNDARMWVEKKWGPQLWKREPGDNSIYAQKKITPYVIKKFFIMAPREIRNPNPN